VQALLPAKVKILGTVPPITSKADMRRSRLTSIEVVFASLLACAGLVLFFLKVRPIL
jgi:hypothetical protein